MALSASLPQFLRSPPVLCHQTLSPQSWYASCDDEIPPNGHGSTKALHITTKVKDRTLPKVLIDNGSSLNVMPLSTLMRLPVDRSYMRHTRTVVKAFDGTRWEVTGEIEIKIQIGPCMFTVEFQVMDISPSYNCLLGRSWIHIAEAVPSTLHQKIKFVTRDESVQLAAHEACVKRLME